MCQVVDGWFFFYHTGKLFRSRNVNAIYKTLILEQLNYKGAVTEIYYKNTNSHKVYYLHKIALMIFLLLNCCAYINAIFFYLSMIYELLLEFFLIHVPVRDQKKIIRCVNISICVTKLCLFFKIVPILLPTANQAVLRILFVAMEI